MSAVEPGKIRNLAVSGHRGTGKTSLIEALLFQSGATTRLGTVEAGTTVSDWDEEERKRQLSLQASLCHVLWRGNKLNLIDTPGDAGFQGDLLASLRVVEGVVLVVSGVMGIEVQTGRIWKRAEELGLARCLVVNMLDRERADFDRFFAGNAKREAAFARNGSTLVGDIHPKAFEVAGAYTPVPGGVGLLTTAMLMANTVRAAKMRRGL